jgi:N-acetylglucosamine-6-phosphate deacetylase
VVVVDEKSARLADRDTLAGSILTLNAALRNMVEFSGCPPHEAVAMATVVPARLLGIDGQKGRLQPGFDADIAVFSPDFEPLLTVAGGSVVFSKN